MFLTAELAPTILNQGAAWLLVGRAGWQGELNPGGAKRTSRREHVDLVLRPRIRKANPDLDAEALEQLVQEAEIEAFGHDEDAFDKRYQDLMAQEREEQDKVREERIANRRQHGAESGNDEGEDETGGQDVDAEFDVDGISAEDVGGDVEAANVGGEDANNDDADVGGGEDAA